jgi:hypothetical protein
LFDAPHYTKPMKEFLTKYAETNRKPARESIDKFAKVFRATAQAILEGIGDQAFKLTHAVNAALCDAVMVGIAARLERGKIADPLQLKAKYQELLAHREFKEAISSATTDEANVQNRLRLAKSYFGQVP